MSTLCPSDFSGVVAYPFDCNKFANCWKGKPTIQNCAPGTQFNAKLGQCDFPHKANCKVSAFKPSPSKSKGSRKSYFSREKAIHVQKLLLDICKEESVWIYEVNFNKVPLTCKFSVAFLMIFHFLFQILSFLNFFFRPGCSGIRGAFRFVEPCPVSAGRTNLISGSALRPAGQASRGWRPLFGIP
jgi:hypothetical protein